MADAGIRGLTPLENSFLVPVDQLTSEEVLKPLIAAITSKTESSLVEFLEPSAVAGNVAHLCGGYALSANGKVRVWPTCCGDLANIEDWKVAAEYNKAEWLEIWIGHPTISVKLLEGQLHLSNLHELGQTPSETVLTLTPPELADAVAMARRTVDEFCERTKRLNNRPA